MNEMKLATWRFPASKMVPPQNNAATMLSVDLASHPDLVGHIADWEAVSHQIVPIDDDILMTVLLRRRVEAPPTAEGI